MADRVVLAYSGGLDTSVASDLGQGGEDLADIRRRALDCGASVNGRRSPSSRYDPDLATYDEGDCFDQGMAEGFVTLHGLSPKTAATRDRGL